MEERNTYQGDIGPTTEIIVTNFLTRYRSDIFQNSEEWLQADVFRRLEHAPLIVEGLDNLEITIIPQEGNGKK